MTVFESRTVASKSMLNADEQSKAGYLAVLEVAKVAVATPRLLLPLGQWVSVDLLREAKASEVVSVAEVVASEVASNNEEAMEVVVAVVLVFKEAEDSEGKTDTVLLLQTLQRARVALVAVGSLEVGEATADHRVHQIATAQAVGMIRVVVVAHMMTEAVVVVVIVATNVMALPEVVQEAIWSR